MRGEIITIGDELISGRVCDQNAHFLSGRLTSFGLEVTAISSVGDDPDHIQDVLSRASARSEFVIVCGGLGPTEDDITTQVAADFFKRPLLLDQKYLDFLRHSVESRGLPWVEAYKKMAYLPEGVRFLNPQGQACGFYLSHGDIQVFFLPGIPAEVRTLTEKNVLPLLLEQDKDKSVVCQRIFKIFGLQEARIGEILEGVSLGETGAMIGFYPNFPEVHVSVTVRAADEALALGALARIEAEVEKRLGTRIVSKDEATLEESVGRLLRAQGLRLAVAESCTGGLIGHRLTSVPGSSGYFDRGLVVYSNKAKQELLGVPAKIIETHGAVSEETAVRMAQGVRAGSGVDLGLAVTGIAGPTGGTEEKPVGTIFIALAGPDGVGAKRFRFSGRRDQITRMTAQTALDWVRRYLSDDTFLFRH